MPKDLAPHWWTEPKSKLPGAVTGVLSVLEYVTRDTANNTYLRLYSGLDALHSLGYGPAAAAGIIFTSNNPMMGRGPKLNVIQSCVDTLTAKTVKNRPRVQFQTEDGDFSLQRKAKLANQFCDGLFYQTHLYELGQEIVRDALVFGTGCLKIYEEDGNIQAERVYPNELLVDQLEAMHSTPRQILQRRYVPREVLASLFPEQRLAIQNTPAAPSAFTSGSLNNLVGVLEIWHLRSAEDAKDGRHAIVLKDTVLLDEPYERKQLPFVFLHYNKRPLGFWGQGLAEMLLGIQIEIHRTIQVIAQSLKLCAVPKILVPNNSKIVKTSINNEIGGIISYAGDPPTYLAPNVVSPELFEHLNLLWDKAFAITGISQLSSQSQKPAGLNSGEAIRSYYDVETERFNLFVQSYEQLYVDAALQFIELASSIYERDREFFVRVPGKKFYRQIDWGDIDLEDDEFSLKAWPTNLLPQTPAGKLDKLQELVQAGWISPESALDLMDAPDLESITSLQNAGIENIKLQIENMLEHGIYSPPEPFQDLHTGLTMVQAAILKAQNDKAPEENVELCRRWLEQAFAMTQPPAPAASPGAPVGGAPAMGGPPQAAPLPPPTSPLLPNAPGQ